MEEWHAAESSELPEGLAALVKPEVAPGERLIWAARSRPVGDSPAESLVQGLTFATGATVVAVVSFAAFGGLFGTRIHVVDPWLAVIGIVSGLLAFVVGSVSVFTYAASIVRGWRPLSWTYALTDRRAIIWSPRPETRGIEVSSYPRGTIRQLGRVEYPDGRGDVTFCSPELRPNSMVSFAGIPNVRQVEDYVRQALLVEPAFDPTPRPE